MQLPKISAALREALAKATPAPAEQSRGTMRVQASATPGEIELLIFGDIGWSWWDDESITAKSVVESLQDFKGSRILVRINSDGGSVTDGIAIHNELRRQARDGVRVDVEIDGAACSIASLIAAAGDSVSMAANTVQMLHAPWGTLWIDGNAKVVREVSDEFATLLDVLGKAMAQSYARKTGKPADHYIAMWDTGRDYWYSADEAMAEGLCDVIVDEPGVDDAPAAAIAEAHLAHLIASAPPALRASVRAAFRSTQSVPAASAPRVPESSAKADASKAATSAAITTKEAEMPNGNTQADNANTATDAQAAVQAAAVAMRARNTEIRAMAAPHAADEEITSYVNGVIDAADASVTAGDVGKQILAMLGKRAQPLNGGGHVVAGGEQRDHNRTAMAAAIDARLGRPDAQAMAGNPFANMTLSEMARASAQAAGIDTRGMDAERYIRAAITHTSSDFPQLLGGAFNRSLLRGYESIPEVFDQFTRAVPVADFRKQSLAGLGQFVGVDEVREGQEYPYGTFSETGQEMRLKKRGAIFSITAEAIQNDDLGVLDSVPFKMGQATRRSLGDDVFALLTTNPVQGDGTALFHADHGNLLTGAALSTASVEAAFAKMALQKDSGGKPIRVPAKFVVVPVGLGATARQILDSQFEVTSGKNASLPNTMRGRFVVIEDPRLDAADPATWYVIADTNSVDGIVIAYLNGVQTPTISQREGWNVDGIEIKVRLAAAAGIADWCALAKNPGA